MMKGIMKKPFQHRHPLSEEWTIRRFTVKRSRPDVLVPIGDDAAAVRPAPGCFLVAATDHMVEGLHFPPYAAVPAGWIAEKLLGSNLSDFAAMGAVPRWALINLALPKKCSPNWLRNFSSSLHSGLRRYRIELIGGDTTATPDTMFLSLTLLGHPASDALLLRGEARPGDALFVSGALGEAAAGMNLLRHKKLSSMSPAERSLFRRHFRPPSRLPMACALARAKCLTASIDISDGLVMDLARLCRASGVGAEIFMERLPLPPAVAANYGMEQAREWALYGGEDYELLFTAAPRYRLKIVRLARRERVAIHEIGRMTAAGKEKVRLVYADRTAMPNPSKLFSHFSARGS
jgi:thiamine-monophosphate kinase